jgi:hypothetical protein
MKKLLVVVCAALFLGGYCLGTASPATLSYVLTPAEMDASGVSNLLKEVRTQKVAEALKALRHALPQGSFAVDGKGRFYQLGSIGIASVWKQVKSESAEESSFLRHNLQEPSSGSSYVSGAGTDEASERSSHQGSGAAGGDGTDAPSAATDHPSGGEPVAPPRARMERAGSDLSNRHNAQYGSNATSKNQRSPRQKTGIGVGAAGGAFAAGSLLYTLIQGLRTKTRRRLMKVALDRIFGGSLEPLSKKEEAMISSLYRDLGIGVGGVVLGGIGAGAGVYLYNKKQTAAPAA